MTRKIDVTYDSESTVYKDFQLASGYISVTTVLFEKEKVVAVIEAKGTVEFYNENDELIAAASAPEVGCGKGVYVDIRCSAENNIIKLLFPIYEWIDNYPNCDGEHDRWDTSIMGYHTLTLELSSNTILEK